MELVKTVSSECIASAKILMAKGKMEEAEQKLIEGLKQAPGAPEICAALCNLYLVLGKNEIPGDWIGNALRHDTSLAQSLKGICSRLYEEKKYEACESILNALLQEDRNNCEAWNDLGAIHFSQGDMTRAEREFKQALAIQPECHDSILNLTALYVAVNQSEHAVQTALSVREKKMIVPPEFLKELAATLEPIAPEEANSLLEKPGGTVKLSCPDEKDLERIGQEEFSSAELNQKCVIWYCTMKCNNKCPYCLAVQTNDPMQKVPYKNYKEWVHAWNRFDGNLLLDIVGGEPFLLPGFVDMINELNDNIKVAITTNTKCDITRFVQEVPPEKCFSITASLHPSSRMNTETFLGKIQLLKNRGFRVVVNYVAYPEQLWMIPYFKNLVEGVGVPFHVDPYGPGPKRPYVLSKKEEAFLKPYIGSDRQEFFNTEPVPYLCSGGMNLFSTLPDGKTYTCVTMRHVEEHYVGNVFDKDFKPRPKPIKCTRPNCAGCDSDKVKRVPLNRKQSPSGQ